MRRTATLLAPFVLLLVGAGCRDVLVDPQPVPQAPQGPSGAATLYMKGPTSLGVTASANYRAQALAGVDHYEWRTVGDGAVGFSYPYGDTRLPVITGSAPGSVAVIAEAYDVHGQVIGLAFKTITVH